MIFFSFWFLCGLISDLVMIIYDLRRKEFNLKYFDSERFMIVAILFLGGAISLFITSALLLFLKVDENKTLINFRISKLLYNIANIGVNKKHKTNAERLSNLLKGNDNSIDSASDEIWNMTKLNDEFEDYHQLRAWLKEECEKPKCTNK